MKVQTKTTSIECTEFGKGEPLIYVPMIGGVGDFFRKQALEFRDRFHTIIYNHREGKDYSHDDVVDDLKAIVDHYRLEKPTIIGESFGGTVALRFAIKYPDSIGRLIVSSSFPWYPRRIRLWLGTFLMSLCPKLFTSIYQNSKWRRIRRNCAESGYPLDPSDRIMISTSGSIKHRLKLVKTIDLRPDLVKIKCPALFIGGDRDLLLHAEPLCRMMAENVKDGRYVVVKKSGHMVMIEKPAEWENIFLDFINTAKI